MSTSLQALAAARPSGRSRPLLIDHDAYATTIIRQGNPIPWADTPDLTSHFGQVLGLLDPDAAWIDVEALYRTRLAASAELLAALGARSRPGAALRALLGDEAAAGFALDTLRTLAHSGRRKLVIDVPSPARWLARAHEAAGTPLAQVDEDRADSASIYLAEWLGRLGELPIAVVVLDARGEPGEQPPEVAERLDAYSALANVAQHFGWSLALRGDERVETAAGEPRVAQLGERFWAGDPQAAEAAQDEVADSDVLIASIPPQAVPEQVLDRLARLR